MTWRYCALVYVLRANCFGIIEKLAAAVRSRAKVVTTSVDKLSIHRLSCQLFSSCFDLSPSADTSPYKRDQERIIILLFSLCSTLPLLVFKLNDS